MRALAANRMSMVLEANCQRPSRQMRSAKLTLAPLSRSLPSGRKRRPDLPSAAQGRGFFGVTGHGDGNVSRAREAIVRGIEATPACAGNIDFRPGVRCAVLALVHLNVARDEACPKPPLPRSLHE